MVIQHGSVQQAIFLEKKNLLMIQFPLLLRAFKAEGSIFLKFLSYSRIQITKEEQRKCMEALVANKYVSLK